MIVVALLALAANALAKAAHKAPDTIEVPVNGSQHVKLGQPISRVSAGNPDIADVAAFPPDELLITGRHLGNTSVTIWLKDETRTIPIVVGFPTEAIGEAILDAIPDGRDIKVTSAGTSLVLSGQVADVADVERAEKVAQGFVSSGTQGQATATSIVNLLTVTGEQQVQLEVSFAEVSRSAMKQIGINALQFGSKDNNYVAGMINPSASFSVNALEGLEPAATKLIDAPLQSTFGFLFGSDPAAAYPFSLALSVLASNGYARVLAEPTLVAVNGEEASFLAGGEFPVPLPQSLGQVVIQYKKFGIQLEFVPTIVDGTIQLRLALTVSDLDFSLGIKIASVTVPGLTSRHSETTVRLRDGQSFAIAGLLSDKVRSSVDKVPLLGDLPILGALFRSTGYRREETELMVVVTAHLVRPQGERPPLPGEGVQADPSDLELFFLGSHESREGGTIPRADEKQKPVGPVGFKR
jgi:pilus assembly protein CpaC